MINLIILYFSKIFAIENPDMNNNILESKNADNASDAEISGFVSVIPKITTNGNISNEVTYEGNGSSTQ